MEPPSESSPFLRLVREAIRVRHYSIRTEEAYVQWIKRFILFHGKRHPSELGEAAVAAFLTQLAVVGDVAASTQNQALNALVFLYRHVLGRPLGEFTGVVRAKRPPKVPVVLTLDEVGRVLRQLKGIQWLVACLQYGSGLRLLESVRIRVKDLDFEHRAIIVRDGKGGKDRVVTLPDELVVPLKRPSPTAGRCSSATARKESARCTCPSRWPGNTRMLSRSGRGSMYSRPISQAWTRAPASGDAIISTRAASRRRCAPPCVTPESRSRRAATLSDTPSPPTCWSAARTFAPSRSSSATAMSRQRRSIPT